MSELLHGCVIRAETIEISVTSTGCTDAADFRFDIDEILGELAVTITRTNQDLCKMVQTVISLELTLPEQLRGKDFRVQNLFARGPRWVVP